MKIRDTFKRLKRENRAALVPFISCGDPSLAFTKRLIKTVCEAGADIVELGVPFSDPMADGPTIQAASLRALRSGTNIPGILRMVGELRRDGVDKPFVLFSYYNPVFKIGAERVAQMSKDAGVDAWLIVDAPLEECGEVLAAIKPRGIDMILLASPFTPPERVEAITKKGSGFLYYVTVAGTTGQRDSLPDGISERLAEVRRASKLPIAAGFGISSPQMAREAAANADAVVIGSKLVDLVHRACVERGEDAALAEAGRFISEISAALSEK